jgi:hypothetical protein
MADLSLGPVSATTLEIDITGGSGVVLPSATVSSAGLLDAVSKGKLDNSIQQNGNSFGTSMNIGTNDSQIVNIRTTGASRMFVQNSWVAFNVPLRNGVTENNSIVNLSTTGTVITRNVADANAALLVNQQNAGSTGNTLTLQNAGSNQLTVSNSGVLTVANLAGAGTRIATANSTGVINTVSSVPVTNGGTGLSGAGTSGQILVSNGSNFVLTTPIEVSSGSFTPTITGADTYMAHGFRYSRVGDIVHISGAVEVSSTNIGNLDFNIGLPTSISSTFTDAYDVTGVVSGLNLLQDNYVAADYINNEPIVKFTTTQLASTVFVQFDFIKQ